MATRNPSLNLASMLRSSSASLASASAEPSPAAGGAAADPLLKAKLAAAANGNGNAVDVDVDDALLRGPRGDWWWTGPRPQDCPGWDPDARCLRSLPMPPTRNFTRAQVLDYFDNCWALTESLFACLQGEEAFLRQPYHRLRHPMIFYYAHPATLYVNKFRVAGLLDAGIDPYCEAIFETGVDEMSWDDLSQARGDWPTVREARAYRARAYAAVRAVLEAHPGLEGGDAAAVVEGAPAWAAFMGFEHERIHLETSSVLIRELPLECVRRPEFWPPYHPSADPYSPRPSAPVPKPGADFPNTFPLVAVRGEEKVALGKPRDFPSFGWDNEYGRKEVDVPDFRASAHKVTNGAFLAFVRAGGYGQRRHWTAEGWGWRSFRNAKWPTFWVPDGPAGLHRYRLRLLFDCVDMRWDWPVDCNYHEAKAYCAWLTEQRGQRVGFRLATEAEHVLMRDARDRPEPPPTVAAAVAATDGQVASTNGGGGKGKAGAQQQQQQQQNRAAADNNSSNEDAPAMAAPGPTGPTRNLHLAFGSQSPVTFFPPTEAGFYDVFGNAQEWCEDHFAALPGFRPDPFYEDFSAPCFGGLHQMILGGSFVSTGQLASKYARYQFRPHFFQHATFRVVQAAVGGLGVEPGGEEEGAALERIYGAEAASGFSPERPCVPFFETTCMDANESFVGDRPCCSKRERRTARCTPTMSDRATADAARAASTKASYETDDLMAQYLSLHFGTCAAGDALSALGGEKNEDGLLRQALGFPAKCGRLAVAAARAAGLDPRECRALDLGCAVGGSTLVMAAAFGRGAVGVDLSQTFVDAAERVRRERVVPYSLREEGDAHLKCEARVESLFSPLVGAPQEEAARAAELADAACERASFAQGDACALPAVALAAGAKGEYECVLAANLLCRVPSPRECLREVHRALKPGGVVVFTSPFTWMQQYTDKAQWLGGQGAGGSGEGGEGGAEGKTCAEALRAELEALGFAVREEGVQPLVIRETKRKYQLILAHKTVAVKLR